jgi:hypothetical protein
MGNAACKPEVLVGFLNFEMGLLEKFWYARHSLGSAPLDVPLPFGSYSWLPPFGSQKLANKKQTQTQTFHSLASNADASRNS